MQEVHFHQGIGFKYNFVCLFLLDFPSPLALKKCCPQFQPIVLDRSPVDDTPLSLPSQPYLLPSYYAGLVINTAVGSAAASGNTKIVELEISAPNLSGYAIFEMGKLVRAVFINLNAWLKSDEGVQERNVYHIDLGFASTDSYTSAKEIRVKRLDIGYADDTSNLTWGGQSWETPTFSVSGKEVYETISPDEGVDIRDTEAVLVCF